MFWPCVALYSYFSKGPILFLFILYKEPKFIVFFKRGGNILWCYCLVVLILMCAIVSMTQNETCKIVFLGIVYSCGCVALCCVKWGCVEVYYDIAQSRVGRSTLVFQSLPKGQGFILGAKE